MALDGYRWRTEKFFVFKIPKLKLGHFCLFFVRPLPPNLEQCAKQDKCWNSSAWVKF